MEFINEVKKYKCQECGSENDVKTLKMKDVSVHLCNKCIIDLKDIASQASLYYVITNMKGNYLVDIMDVHDKIMPLITHSKYGACKRFYSINDAQDVLDKLDKCLSNQSYVIKSNLEV